MTTNTKVYVTGWHLFLGSSRHQLRVYEMWDFVDVYSQTQTHTLIILCFVERMGGCLVCHPYGVKNTSVA